MARIIASTALLVFIGAGFARAEDYPFLDGLTRYAERIDTVTVESGDAENVNAALQTIDPWPRHAFDRRIPANGQRMVGAVGRYQDPRRLGAQAPTLAPVTPIGGGAN